MAAAIASRGIQVIGVDSDQTVVDAFAAGEPLSDEPLLRELISENRDRLKATHDLDEAVSSSDISFIVVPTPSDESGLFNIESVKQVVRRIGAVLKDDSPERYHLIVVTSTVLPGSTRHGILPILEDTVGQNGAQFGVCYSPEFIALGSVIRDFLNPDFVLIGEENSRDGETLESLYRTIIPGVAVARMSLENAELAKIALNSFITTKISFANGLADLCERIPGCDVDVVTRAIGLDHRIGPASIRGGLGFGGPCFPRDNRALASFAAYLGTSLAIPKAADAENDAVVNRTLELLADEVGPETKVAILGLAYKSGTSITEHSQAVDLGIALSAIGAHVYGYDPAVSPRSPDLIGISWTGSFEESLFDADVVLLTSFDKEMAFLVEENLELVAPHALIVDFWRNLNAAAIEKYPVRYHAVGRNDRGQASGLLREMWADEGVLRQ
jgi:UDPglucose 6-dehydrogenase